MLALDSLALAMLIGVLAEIEGMTPSHQGRLQLDSISISLSVETIETLFLQQDLVTRLHKYGNHRAALAPSARQSALASYPDQAAVLTTAWGVGSLFGKEIGYLSVAERAGPANWSIRTAAVRSLDPPREEEVRWSLVHGIF